MINILSFQCFFAIIALIEDGDRMSIMKLAMALEKFDFGFNKLSYELLEEIKPEGITSVQFTILQYLSDGESITLSQISCCLGMSVPNTSREVKKLFEKSLIRKIPDEYDKRASLISLSPTGSELMNAAFTRLKKNIAVKYAHLESGEIVEVVKALAFISEKLLK